ncbi:MAG: TMEM43 family protein [Armatimonadota bacterium]
MNINVGSSGSRSGGCSIFGILIGLLLIPAGFYMVYYGEVQLINHGDEFEAVEMMTLEDATAADDTTVKFRGMPQGEHLDVDYYDKPVLYFKWVREMYERDEDSDGDVTYDWETQESKYKIAPFSIGSIDVRAGSAKIVGAQKVFEGIRPNSSRSDAFDPTLTGRHSPSVGDQRLTVEVIDIGKELIVFGHKAGSVIEQGGGEAGKTFVVSALGDEGTADFLQSEYRLYYWMLKGGAVLAIAIGILMVLGPLTTLFGYIPMVGQGLNAVIGAFAFGFALISVLLITLFLKLFWLLVALVVVGILIAVVLAVRSPRQPPESAAAATAPPKPPARPSSTSATETTESQEDSSDPEGPSIARPVSDDDRSDSDDDW